METSGYRSEAYAQFLADRFYRRYLYEGIKVMTTCKYCKESFAERADIVEATVFQYCSPKCRDDSYGNCNCCYNRD
jgi:hypothetical protein